MSKKQKKILVLAGAFALAFGIVPNVSAMHIMEGYLPGSFCIAWGVLCVPFLIAGFMSIKKTLNEHRNLITMLAMSGAFIFVISSLKIPSVTGSCSHMTGTGLGAILFGPAAVSILGLIVLLFQAILLAHGGLTTLGANTFSMAIAGPFVSYGIYVLCKKINGLLFSLRLLWAICLPTASQPASLLLLITQTLPSELPWANSWLFSHQHRYLLPLSKVSSL